MWSKELAGLSSGRIPHLRAILLSLGMQGYVGFFVRSILPACGRWDAFIANRKPSKKKAKEIAERRALEKEMSDLDKVDIDAPRGTRGNRKPLVHHKSTDVASDVAKEFGDDSGRMVTTTGAKGWLCLRARRLVN
jgi:hypothetical protein